MTEIYVLLMLWTTGSYNGGVGVVQQEFTSAATCEAAWSSMARGASLTT